jgi:hypothetical protein
MKNFHSFYIFLKNSVLNTIFQDSINSGSSVNLIFVNLSHLFISFAHFTFKSLIATILSPSFKIFQFTSFTIISSSLENQVQSSSGLYSQLSQSVLSCQSLHIVFLLKNSFFDIIKKEEIILKFLKESNDTIRKIEILNIIPNNFNKKEILKILIS